MEELLNVNIFADHETIAWDYIEKYEFPWLVLGEIENIIMEIGKSLDPEKYEKRGENIWVAKSATVFDSAYLNGPLIIDEGAEIRQCAFIRGNALVGKNCVVGNSTELKNVILFDNVQVPHYNYVGDSLLGYKSHMGAGSITSNVKSDKKNVSIRLTDDIKVETHRKKVGAILGSRVEIGCGSILNPGTVICSDSNVYPLSSVRGYVPANSIYKAKDDIVEKF